MRNIWLISAMLVPLFAGPAGSAQVLAAPAPGPLVAQADAVPQLAPDDRILGKADAPITIFEYASLTCPHCAAFDKEMLPQIKTDWIDTGKAKLVFRDYPLDGSALKAAIVARCAPPERFYGFIDILFAQQASWGLSPDPVPGIARIAKLGGMSEDQVQACLKDDALQNKILAGRLTAEKDYKVESTPTFFINGKRVVGARSDEILDALKAASKT
jgi:protein-disulfide isomerase